MLESLTATFPSRLKTICCEKINWKSFFNFFQTTYRNSSENGFWFDFRGDWWVRSISANQLLTAVSARIIRRCEQFELRLHSRNTKLSVSDERAARRTDNNFSFDSNEFPVALYRIAMIPLNQSTTSHGSIILCPAKPIHSEYSHRISAYVTQARTSYKIGTSQINSSSSVAMNCRKMLRKNAIDGSTINTMTKPLSRSGR